jgi:hypothetical protein
MAEIRQLSATSLAAKRSENCAKPSHDDTKLFLQLRKGKAAPGMTGRCGE